MNIDWIVSDTAAHNLLDNSAAKHKLSIMPKKNHSRSMHRSSASILSDQTATISTTMTNTNNTSINNNTQNSATHSNNCQETDDQMYVEQSIHFLKPY